MSAYRTKTIIYYPTKSVARVIDDMLYQPENAIQIKSIVFTKWSVLDEFYDTSLITRHIYLEQPEHGHMVKEDAISIPQPHKQSMHIN